MTMISPDERAAMREGFGRLLAEKCAEADIRRVMATQSGNDPALWTAMADMGITALMVSDDHDGIGAGPVEIEEIMEEAGAALLAGPLLSSAFVAASLIGLSHDADAKARLLPAIASGEKIATVAFTGDSGSWDVAGVTVTAQPQGNQWILSGAASFVLSANLADILLVFAQTPDGLGCFEVDPAHVQIEPLQSWDPSLRLSKILFDEAQAVHIAGVNDVTFEQTLDIARVALAGEQAGACRKIFDITVDYLKTRVQFGRPIGGFQAIKHMAADLLIEVESATSAARAAARALDADAPDKNVLINLAAFACADAFSQVAATAIQMHGGIAFTWEHPAHLYLRRARADAQLFGQSDVYRERFVAAMEKAA
ncbi:acyl-CoA dehydrogenase family protein [Sphingobium sp. Z007]|uniref:acyl-CoA dehydrogenase family protein n=1 Tax=Sphingobium sp. Z007 TaxID=627495 RepID=UPI000B49D403|nr:acyl-CoA dehydrogenase family protein [Sphingobium sp. Z007]